MLAHIGLFVRTVAKVVVAIGRRRSLTPLGLPAPQTVAAPAGDDTTTVELPPRFVFVGVEHLHGLATRTISGPTLIDLTKVYELTVDVFAEIAAAWTAIADTVPCVGFVMPFERWALLHHAARNALAPVVAQGVAVELFYTEQREGGQVDFWFEDGRLVHNLPAVIARLRQRWGVLTGPGNWPAVIDTHAGPNHWPILISTLAGLVRSECSGNDVPAMLIEVAGLAQLSNHFDVAGKLALEALSSLTTPSGTRADALRCLGIALICQEQPAAGQAALKQAVTVATACGEPTVAARALFELGFVTLEQRDYLSSQRAFRAAVDLLTDSRTRLPSLLALAHQGLALALMQGGYVEAEYHARAAHALHSGLDPEQAEFDRQLIKLLMKTYADNS